MNAIEAGTIELGEPDWTAEWEASLGDDFAFEDLILHWRKWHFTWVEVRGQQKKKLASSIDAMIALANLGLFPPRDMPDHLAPRAPGLFEEQHDAHCWLVSSDARAWRVVAIEDKTMILDSFGEAKQLDITRTPWVQVIERAVAVLEGMREKGPATPGAEPFPKGATPQHDVAVI